MLVIGYIRVEAWLQTSYRQIYHIRVALLQAVLRQEIGWFDTNDPGELGSRLSESVQTVFHSSVYCIVYVACTAHSRGSRYSLLLHNVTIGLIIIIIIISTTMFMVLSSWQSHCESSPGSFDECRTTPSGRRPKTKPDNLGCESACTGCQKLRPPSPFIITQPES